MNFESSRMTDIFTDCGSVRWIDASRARTPSMTSTVFSPIARRMSRMTAGLSPDHTDEVGRSELSSAWPMSDTRIGVPFLLAMTMLLKSSAASMRPIVRSSSWPLPCSTAPPGISTFSATTASRTSDIDSPYEFSFSMSTTMWISRARLPAIVTWPTPFTV